MKDKKAHFRGKTAVVTGAAGGIGEALCTKLAEEFGMNIVITGRDQAKLSALAERLTDFGVKVECCVGDLGEIDFLDSIVRRSEEIFGGIDVLVNNAGLSQSCPVEEMTPELFDDIMKVNARAPYFLSQKALPALRKSDCATIINICSVVAHKGYPLQSVYAASKHALYGFSKSLANEVYSDGIRVHVISPGGVFTPMIAIMRPDLTPDCMMLPEDIANIMAFYLENRMTNAVIDEIEVHRMNKAPFA